MINVIHTEEQPSEWRIRVGASSPRGIYLWFFFFLSPGACAEPEGKLTLFFLF